MMLFVRTWISLAPALLASCTLLFDDSEESGADHLPGADIKVWSGSSARHTCASRGAEVVCWGDNTFGQLGTGNKDPQRDVSTLTPFQLPSSDNPSDVVEMSLSYGHTCAVLANGGVHCWGKNTEGELGLGDASDRPAPLSSAVPLGVDVLAYHLSAGFDHTCAQIQNNKVQCWGNVGSLVDAFALEDVDTIWGDDELPQDKEALPLDFPVQALGLGLEHGCALSVDRETVQCWGDMAGVGSNALDGRIDLPAPAKQIVSGEHFSCVRYVDDAINCWGNNDTGQLGRVGGGYVEALPADDLAFDTTKGAVQLEVGARHSCALFYDGFLRCWGQGLFGAVGRGNSDDVGLDMNLQFTETRVPFDEAVEDIAAGARHTCAVLASGAIRCFGSNVSHQLGVGTSCDELGGEGNLCNYGDDADELPIGGTDIFVFEN